MPNFITGNSIYDNNLKGINYPQNDIEVDPPAIIFQDIELGLVSGQSCPGCTVEIFSTDRDEGKTYEGSTQADEYGNYYFEKGHAFSAFVLTATAYFERHTSEFSNPVNQNSAILAAIDAVQNSPTFETGFNVWEFGDPGENVSIENGFLMLPSEGRNISQMVSSQNSYYLAVQYEFQITESDLEGTCYFGLSNEEQNLALGFGFREDGSTFTEYYLYPDQYPRIVQGHYGYFSDKPNEVLIVGIEDRYSVFVNNQLVYSFIDPAGSAGYNEQTFSAEGGVTCQVDNYKIWNLDGLEFDRQEDPLINSINSYIHSNQATLENGFNQSDPDWLINTKDGLVSSQNFIIDDSLVVNNSNANLNEHDITFPPDSLISRNSVIAFSVDASDFSVPAQFGLIIRWADQSSDYLQIYFDPQENRINYKPNRFTDYSVSREIDLSIPHRVRIITYHQYLAVWVDGKTISLSYIGEQQDGYNSHFFVEQKDSNEAIEGDYQIKFDEIRFWDLDEVEFDVGMDSEQDNSANLTERIMTYTIVTSTTFEDDFSTPKEEWGDVQWGDNQEQLVNFLNGGKLVFDPMGPSTDHVFPNNGLLNAENFAVSIDYYSAGNLEEQSSLKLVFREDINTNSYYDLRIGNGEWYIEQKKGNQFYTINQGRTGWFSKTELQIIAYDNQFAFFMDGDLIALEDNLTLEGITNYFSIGNINSHNELDNFKFWNLDGVESLQ